MKPLYHALALSTAFWAGSTALAGSVGAPQAGQTVALGNLNAVILSGTSNGFYYAGGNSSSSNFAGGGTPGPFLGGSVPADPSQPVIPSLFLAPSGPSFLSSGTGSGGASNSNSSSNTSGSNNSNSNNSSSNNSSSNNSNNSNNSSGSNKSSGETSGTTGPISAQLLQSPVNAVAANVPDNGTAIALLGAALAGLALLRRKFHV